MKMWQWARSFAADCARNISGAREFLTTVGAARQTLSVDDLSRAWAILNIQPGSSEEAVRSAYRELVKVWHPDRFQGDADRLDEAHEMLKEINWAYDHLRAKVFVNQTATPTVEVGDTLEAAPVSNAEPDISEPVGEARGGLGLLWIVLLLIVVGVGFYFFKRHQKIVARPNTTESTQTNETYGPNTPSAQVPTEVPAPAKPRDQGQNILRAMIPANKLKVENSPDGFVLNGSEGWEYLKAPQPTRPPFVFRASVKTSEADVRFYYGLGRVILNWTDNPTELRVHDFATSDGIGVRRKGMLAPDVWHDLVFDVRTNGMKVLVDDELRFEGQGFYRNLNSAPGIGPSGGPITVRSVVLETPAGADVADGTVRPRVLVPGDLLATMTTVNRIQTNSDLEGMILTDPERTGGAIQTQQKFHPPLIIRTRAKTDALNLRLSFGSGIVIFNWEVNPAELRVHDPANGRVNAIAGKGRILPNEWHDVVWEIARTGMRVIVDGQIRFQCSNDYSKLDATAGIGTFLSQLKVASFVVEQK